MMPISLKASYNTYGRADVIWAELLCLNYISVLNETGFNFP